MKVHLTQNPNRPSGFIADFPWSRADVDLLKSCLGFEWNNNRRVWESVGPEVLLDMQRFGIGIDWISENAKEIAEAFRQQLWQVMDVRLESIDEHEYAYQEQGSKILALQPNMILGDDMGLGKSKQALDALARITWQRVLIICPKTLTYNWLDEVQKWHPEFTALLVPDNKRKEFWEEIEGREEPLIIIANYEKLRTNDWPKDMEWTVVIFDEAQRVKNAQTVTYKILNRVLKHSEYAWALTGTPLEIRLPELYNIMKLLRPAVLGGFYRFRDQHLITDWAGTVTGVRNLELLRDRIGPFLLRRTKKEVLHQLPPKLPPNNIFIKMSPGEQRDYQQMTMNFNAWLRENSVGGSGDQLVQLLRMQQFCCTPMLFTEELGRGTKYEALLELLQDWPGRAVIFCFFEEVVSLLRNWLAQDVDYNSDAWISGKLSDPQERIRRAREFSEGRLGKVFISTDAGQVGINMPGADLIVHYDQLWNPQKMKQREDRLHRIGQQNPVNVVNLLMIGSIDVGKYQLNLEREGLFTDVVEGAEEALLRKLDAPRLRRIVEGRYANNGS